MVILIAWIVVMVTQIYVYKIVYIDHAQYFVYKLYLTKSGKKGRVDRKMLSLDLTM